jgi:hypothetical protein
LDFAVYRIDWKAFGMVRKAARGVIVRRTLAN